MIKEILKAIIPTSITTLFTGIYIIIDGLFIGQKMGELGLAAINIAWPIAAFIQSLGVALGTASGIFISYYRGKNDQEKIKKILTNSIFVLLFFTLISMSIIFYKENLLILIGGSEDTLPLAKEYITMIIYSSIIEIASGMIVGIMRNFTHYKSTAIILLTSTLVNFLLDYLFIIVLPLNLFGAALASIISQIVTIISSLIILIIYKNLKFSKSFDIKLIFKILLKGIAPFILTYSASFIIILYNLFCYNHGGNEAVAAYTVVAYIVYVAQYISIGISDGIQPILTYHYSINDKNLNKYFYKTLAILVSLLLILSLIFNFIPRPLANLFNVNGKAKDYFIESFYYFVWAFIFIGTVRIYASRFYSTNEEAKANIIVLIEPIITPIFLFILTIFLNTKGIWLSFLIIQIILAISSIIISRFNIKVFSLKSMEE